MDCMSTSRIVKFVQPESVYGYVEFLQERRDYSEGNVQNTALVAHAQDYQFKGFCYLVRSQTNYGFSVLKT